MAKQDNTMKIVGLIINLFLPGVGTLIGGGESRKNTGIRQLGIYIISIIATFTVGWIVGLLLCAIAWIWALITSIQMVKE